MGLLSNHLKQVAEKECQQNNDNIKMCNAFSVLHHSLLEHFHSSVDAQLTVFCQGNNKKIIISASSYIFYITEKFNSHERKTNITISDDNLEKKIFIVLRYNEKTNKWRIKKISHGKFKYTLRVFNPIIIEELMIHLTLHV